VRKDVRIRGYFRSQERPAGMKVWVTLLCSHISPDDSSEQAAQSHALRLQVEGSVGDLHLVGHNVANCLPT